MKLKNKTLSDTVEIGLVLTAQAVLPRIEAFSENAIYCRREMPTMSKYKTVKEVCALTGLTRKHLYYFHHEGVVRAVAYANYSVEDYDGYKLYDDAAVEKLQQIAMYYQLGLRRDEIKAIMLAPGYDSNEVLNTLLALQREKRIHIERSIAALEYLVLVGTKNSVSGALRGISLDDLGRMLLEVRSTVTEERQTHSETQNSVEVFEREFSALITELAQLDEAALKASGADSVISRILQLSNAQFGKDGLPFVLGLFMSVLGEGSIAQVLAERLRPAHGRAVIRYMLDHYEIFGESTHAECREG